MPLALPLIQLSLALLLSVAALPALAMVLGPGTSEAVLGQPLDFSTQVRADPGAALALDCVTAEVTLGERRLAPAALRVSVLPTGANVARLRVQSSITVDEPIVQVVMTLGCESRVSRRYVLLAEPPGYTPPAPSPVAAAAVPDAAATLAPPPPSSSGQSGQAGQAGQSAPAEGAGARSDAAPAAPEAAVTRARPPTAALTPPRVAERPRRVPAPDAALSNPAPAAARPRPAPAVAAARPAPEAALTRQSPEAGDAGRRADAAPARREAQAEVPPTPRLRMEGIAPAAAFPPVQADARSVVQALLAAAQAASAAESAAAAASAAVSRMAVLEQSVEKLRTEAASSRETASQLRDRLARSEESSQWVMPLVAVALGLGALTGWLALRLGALQKQRQVDWQRASVRPPPPSAAAAEPSQAPASGGSGSGRVSTAPTPFVTADTGPPSMSPALSPRTAQTWPNSAPLSVDPWSAPETADTQPLRGLHEPAAGSAAEKRIHFKPADDVADDGATRDVTIEELIDLEQQAEFFVVLGQEDAALDLLVEHLRSTGGSSPLPYLKLLEIYRRRGEHEAYERTRSRFNHRFNAYAPEWGSDLMAGLSLEDYPGIIPRLQQVWPRPLDAMAELEALLFRKSRGELFELPAYREVLFLYSIARDLLDREAADNGGVDLLLPMSERGLPAADADNPQSTLPASMYDADDRPTEPLDLDVTGGEKRSSIFGQLDDAAPADRATRRIDPRS